MKYFNIKTALCIDTTFVLSYIYIYYTIEMVRTEIEVFQNCNQGKSLLTDNLFIFIK